MVLLYDTFYMYMTSDNVFSDWLTSLETFFDKKKKNKNKKQKNKKTKKKTLYIRGEYDIPAS